MKRPGATAALPWALVAMSVAWGCDASNWPLPQPDGSTTVPFPERLDVNATDITIDGVLAPRAPGASPSPIVVGCKILTPSEGLLHGMLTLAESSASANDWDVSFALDPQYAASESGWVSSPLPVGVGTLSFDSSGNLASTSLSALNLSFGASGTRAFKVLAAALTQSASATGSHIGLLPGESESAIPKGAVGEVEAGSYAVPFYVQGDKGGFYPATLVLSRDLDQQRGAIPAGQPLNWLCSLVWSDPRILEVGGDDNIVSARGVPFLLGPASISASGTASAVPELFNQLDELHFQFSQDQSRPDLALGAQLGRGGLVQGFTVWALD